MAKAEQAYTVALVGFAENESATFESFFRLAARRPPVRLLPDTGGVLTLFIAAPPNGSSVWVRVVDEVSGAVFEQEITADLPAATTPACLDAGCGEGYYLRELAGTATIFRRGTSCWADTALVQ